MLFSVVLFFNSPYRSKFARAVSFKREIVGPITLRSFIRAKREGPNVAAQKLVRSFFRLKATRTKRIQRIMKIKPEFMFTQMAKTKSQSHSLTIKA